MTRIRAETVVNAAQTAVFDTFTDFLKTADMVTAIERIEMLTPPPIGVGTRFRETRIMLGKQASEEMTVFVFDRPRLCELQASSHGMLYRSAYEFVPQGGATRVTLTFEGTPQTLVARILGALMGPMIRSSMQKMMKKDMEDVKAHIEAKARAR